MLKSLDDPTVMVGSRVKVSLAREIDEFAQQRGSSVSKELRLAIVDHMARVRGSVREMQTA
jgi:hypothetical protein